MNSVTGASGQKTETGAKLFGDLVLNSLQKSILNRREWSRHADRGTYDANQRVGDTIHRCVKRPGAKWPEVLSQIHFLEEHHIGRLFGPVR